MQLGFWYGPKLLVGMKDTMDNTFVWMSYRYKIFVTHDTNQPIQPSRYHPHDSGSSLFTYIFVFQSFHSQQKHKIEATHLYVDSFAIHYAHFLLFPLIPFCAISSHQNCILRLSNLTLRLFSAKTLLIVSDWLL